MVLRFTEGGTDYCLEPGKVYDLTVTGHISTLLKQGYLIPQYG